MTISGVRGSPFGGGPGRLNIVRSPPRSGPSCRTPRSSSSTASSPPRPVPSARRRRPPALLAEPRQEWLDRAAPPRGRAPGSRRSPRRKRPSHQTCFVHRDLPPTLRARAIRYHHRGFRPQTLLTSLLDPVAYPAAELVAPRALGARTRLRRGEDAHAGARRGAAQQDARTHPARSVGPRPRLQSGAPRHGSGRRAGRYRPDTHQLSPCAPIHPSLLAHRVDHEPRGPAAAPRGPARRTRAADPPRSPPVPALSTRRQDQNEQLPAQTSATSEASP